MRWLCVLGLLVFTAMEISAQLEDESTLAAMTVNDVTVPASFLRLESFRPVGNAITLSLKEAVQLANRQNPSLQIAEHGLNRSFYDLEDTYSAYRTLIDLVGSAEENLTQREGGVIRFDPNLGEVRTIGRVSENDELISVGPRFRRTFRNAVSVDVNPSMDYLRDTERRFDVSNGVGYRDDTQYRFNTSINVPLNSRPRLEIDTAIENAELDAIRSDYDLFIQKESIQQQVINAYWNIQQTQEELKITGDRLLQAKQIAFVLRVQYENEREAKVQVDQAEVDVLSNEATFIQQEGALRSSIEQFNILLGTPVETRLQLTDELIVEALPMNADEYISLITSTNLEIKDLNVAIQQLENNLRVTKLGQQPDLSFTTTFNRNDEGAQDLSFGLMFSWNVFNGGSTKARTRALMESLEQQQINLWNLERQIIQESYDDLRELQLQEQRIEILERNVEQAARTLDNALIQFREFGAISFRNMQDFQIDLAQARSNLLQSKVLFNRARAQLLQKVHYYEPDERVSPLLEILR